MWWLGATCQKVINQCCSDSTTPYVITRCKWVKSSAISVAVWLLSSCCVSLPVDRRPPVLVPGSWWGSQHPEWVRCPGLQACPLPLRLVAVHCSPPPCGHSPRQAPHHWPHHWHRHSTLQQNESWSNHCKYWATLILDYEYTTASYIRDLTVCSLIIYFWSLVCLGCCSETLLYLICALQQYISRRPQINVLSHLRTAVFTCLQGIIPGPTRKYSIVQWLFFFFFESHSDGMTMSDIQSNL